jgi:hypothetical protein
MSVNGWRGGRDGPVMVSKGGDTWELRDSLFGAQRGEERSSISCGGEQWCLRCLL